SPRGEKGRGAGSGPGCRSLERRVGPRRRPRLPPPSSALRAPSARRGEGGLCAPGDRLSALPQPLRLIPAPGLPQHARVVRRGFGRRWMFRPQDSARFRYGPLIQPECQFLSSLVAEKIGLVDERQHVIGMVRPAGTADIMFILVGERLGFG